MKALKIIGFILLGIIVIVAIFLGYLSSTPIPSYELNVPTYEAKSSPEAIQRGKKLATMLCSNCHMNRATGKLTGIRMADAPAEFGAIYTPNITQDPTYGIGNWTDAELLYLLRTGIKKDGQYAPVYMPKFPNMSDQDINSIIAYLKSDEPEVQADPTPDRPAEPSVLTKLLCRVAWKPLPFPEQPIAHPDSTDVIGLGKYLAHNLDCYACHSADFKTLDLISPENSEGYFGGGNQPLNLEGQPISTSNLTPDEKTGIGSWTEEQFTSAVKYGLKEGEPSLRYPMMPYVQLDSLEVSSIYQYLQTVPPIQNEVKRSMLE